MWIPALGYYLGAGYVRVSDFDNKVAWSIPAGDRTYAKGIYDFNNKNLASQTLDRFTLVFKVNTVRYTKETGFYIYSSRTMSKKFLYESVHIRLQTNWIIANLLVNNIKFRERLNTPNLRNTMKIENRMWFQNMYNNGGVEASVPFDDAVVIVVKTDIQNRKNLGMTIGWIPTETIESIEIQLNRNDGVLSITG